MSFKFIPGKKGVLFVIAGVIGAFGLVLTTLAADPEPAPHPLEALHAAETLIPLAATNQDPVLSLAILRVLDITSQENDLSKFWETETLTELIAAAKDPIINALKLRSNRKPRGDPPFVTYRFDIPVDLDWSIKCVFNAGDSFYIGPQLYKDALGAALEIDVRDAGNQALGRSHNPGPAEVANTKLVSVSVERTGEIVFTLSNVGTAAATGILNLPFTESKCEQTQT